MTLPRHPTATHHLPPFVTPPGETDVLLVVSFAILLGSVLGVGLIFLRLHTLPERMAYDKEILVVKAGKPVEFLLDNSDLMPHNFIILQSGSLEEIGMESEKSELPATGSVQALNCARLSSQRRLWTRLCWMTTKATVSWEQSQL